MRVSNVVSSDFYAVAAQVIPVLFIALAFETRSKSFLPEELHEDQSKAGRRLEVTAACYSLVVTLFLAGGEVAALVGIRLGTEPDFHMFHTAWFVTLGLFIGGTGVVVPIALRQLWVISGGLENLGWFKVWLSVIVVVGTVYIAAYTVWTLV